MTTRAGLAVSVAFLALSVSFAAHARMDVHAIVERSVAVSIADREASPEYNFTQTDKTSDGTKTYRVLMIERSPYNELIAVNGKPLSGDDAARERKKLEETIAKRRSESAEDRAHRIEKYKKDLRRDEGFIREMTNALQFKLVGEEQIYGHKAYVLQATPRPGYQPKTNEGKVMTGMEGKLWIDKQTFRWVKAEAHVTQPVSIEGFLARVEPGTRFEIENMPVSGNIWLPKHFTMNSSAKVMGIFDEKSQKDETYFDYQRASDPQSSPRGENASNPEQ